MTEKTETNAKLGRLYFQVLNDAQGYPNGMPYWPEMTPGQKYHYAMTALDFIDFLVKEGYITLNKPIGVGEYPRFNEGECKELMDHFKENQVKELEGFQKRLDDLKAIQERKG